MAKRNRWDSDSEDDDARGDERRRRAQERKSSSKRKEQGDSAAHADTALSAKQNGSEPAPSTSPNAITKQLELDARQQLQSLQHNFYLHGCRSVDNYARIGKIDEGTYG
ncbi:Cmgc/cdk protein kinase, partial [Globisporangium polare]